jgi:hypothetical protein
MWVQANDGMQWGAWAIFNINPAVDHPAVVTATKSLTQKVLAVYHRL